MASQTPLHDEMDRQRKDILREFKSESASVLIRRDKVSAIKPAPVMFDPLMTGVLVEGVWFWLEADYEAVRDWVRGT
jgi:hypothetical protein